MTPASVGFHCPECAKTGAQRVYRPADLEQRPTLTYVLIAINIVVFIAQLVSGGGGGPTSGEVYLRGVLYGPLVQEGEFYRIVTSGFMHASIMHIAFNMYALWVFAPNLERQLGWLRTLLIYAGGLFGGAAAVLWFNWQTATLGASGAVLGLAGGLWAVLKSSGVPFKSASLGGILLINLALPVLIGRISFWGHLGGIAGGFLIGGVLGLLPTKGNQSTSTSIWVAGVCVVGLFALGAAGGLAGGVG